MQPFVWCSLLVAVRAMVLSADSNRHPSFEQSQFMQFSAPLPYAVIHANVPSALELIVNVGSQPALHIAVDQVMPSEIQNNIPSCCYNASTRDLSAWLELHFQPAPVSTMIGRYSNVDLNVPVGTHIITATNT